MTDFAAHSDGEWIRYSQSCHHCLDIILSLDPLQFYETLRSCNDSYLSSCLNQALDALCDSLRLYGPENVLSSYNGGKDAEVIMHLLRAVCAKYSKDHHCHCLPKLVYFAIDDEFVEVIDHIDAVEQRYPLELTRYNCGIVEVNKSIVYIWVSILINWLTILHKQGLQQHITGRKNPSHPAFVLGTRKGDPNSESLQIFAPSSTWMPVPFMRVNPIMNWYDSLIHCSNSFRCCYGFCCREYGHVWHFLRLFNLPYCRLYENGFTSLGKKSLTFPNPQLLRKDPSCVEVKYWPAYLLTDWSLERAGRVSNEQDALKLEAAALLAKSQAQNDHGSLDSLNSLVSSSCSTSLKSVSSSILAIETCETAALVVIGDEILNGFATEENIQVAARALLAIGIPLKTVSIVADEVEAIASEVERLSQLFDILITSGGIGPTHDDVTLQAIAIALNQSISLNSSMLAHLVEVNEASAGSKTTNSAQNESDMSLDDSMQRLAMLPACSRLHFPPAPDNIVTTTKKDTNNVSHIVTNKAWPVLQCKNIFVLPGVPQFFANKMHLLVKYFLPRREMQEKRSIVLGIEERSIVAYLNRLVTVCTQVKIGSYPFENHRDFKTIITIEGRNEQLVDDAVAELLKYLPHSAVLRVENGEKYDLC
jgi:FAD synthetase